MAGEVLIRGVVANAPSFLNSLATIKDARLRATIVASLRDLFLQPRDHLPAKLKFHPLKDKLVASAVKPGEKVKAWSLHVTPDDVYKASFTFEDSVIYLRQVDTHDVIDRRP
jgi:hypothetical protein